MKKHFRKEYLAISLSVIALVAGCCSAIAQDTVEARVVDYSQGKASYYVSGSGEPIILLHGAAVSAQTNWSTLVPLLERERRVININLVGAGNTTFQKDQLSIDDLVALVIAVADAEEAERFSVVGYSTGAVAGLAVAARHPERINRFIAVAPWADSDARTQSFFLLWERIYAVDPTLFIHFNTHLALSEQTQLQMDAEAFSSTKRNFENAGFNDDLGKVINLLQRVDVAQVIEQN